MGRVYWGRSPGGRAVAVKVVRPELADDGDFRRRFARVGTAARRVNGLFTAGAVDTDPYGSPERGRVLLARRGRRGRWGLSAGRRPGLLGTVPRAGGPARRDTVHRPRRRSAAAALAGVRAAGGGTDARATPGGGPVAREAADQRLLGHLRSEGTTGTGPGRAPVRHARPALGARGARRLRTGGGDEPRSFPVDAPFAGAFRRADAAPPSGEAPRSGARADRPARPRHGRDHAVVLTERPVVLPHQDETATTATYVRIGYADGWQVEDV
ncbi:hypothetical protein SAMN02787118_101853 [Streptomyces mirabilis]|uniref:Protein kinase domain-containing protein n=1 Tax=Streptomyces mirabilis TaxID=68239 RepID=A0A1I2AW68_9ACTN|nr:hypothetical protein SAMN02787118_101853 [Streptomyces mirabilis]